MAKPRIRCLRQSGRGRNSIVQSASVLRHDSRHRHQRDGRPRAFAPLLLAAILIAGFLAGCVTPPNARKDLFAFFAPGKTTREEVMLQLGQPSGSFEQERIFTYRIGQYGEEGYYIISPKVVLPAQAASWQNVRFSLVIVFDEQGRLRKHQLVRVD